LRYSERQTAFMLTKGYGGLRRLGSEQKNRGSSSADELWPIGGSAWAAAARTIEETTIM
jgi:hypothetical protein